MVAPCQADTLKMPTITTTLFFVYVSVSGFGTPGFDIEHNTPFHYHLTLLHYPLERIGPFGHYLQQPSMQIASHYRLSVACNRVRCRDCRK